MQLKPSLLAFAALAACSAPASPSASSAPAPAPAPAPAVAAPALTADGQRFAAETKYQGPCAEGRGGCYGYTFKPDGSAVHTLLDARDAGTYRIEGTTIVYRSASPDSQDERITSADGFRTLPGDYRLAP